MIIKSKPIPFIFLRWGTAMMYRIFRRRFNKMIIHDIEIKPNCSYLLMCNHFSFLDGFLAMYLTMNGITSKQALRGFYMMSLKKQMQKNWWLKYLGAFSVVPGSRTTEESLNFAVDILNQPGNLLLYYPQADLESMHIRDIEFKDGVATIISRVKGDCQLIWSSNILEFFESISPSVYFNMLDCGMNHNFDFEKMKKNVNVHHKKSLRKMVRYTKDSL
jgi:1-acyl-sn-glycerol-3-phosphate acyltransferase